MGTAGLEEKWVGSGAGTGLEKGLAATGWEKGLGFAAVAKGLAAAAGAEKGAVVVECLGL